MALVSRNGLTLNETRPITAAIHVIHVASAGSMAATLQRLRADSEVEYAEADQRRYAHAVPNDTLYSSQQWYLQPTSSTVLSAIDAQTAWDTTKGSSTLVIADLDTGVRFDHPDLLTVAAGTGRLLSGYCFITERI
jgi:serine protease